MIEIRLDLLRVVVSEHNKWYQSSRLRLGYSEDSKGSRTDQVEIVCRSQVRGIGVRGDRVSISGGRREGSLNQGWNRSGEKLKLGFQGRGKNHLFYLRNRSILQVFDLPHS